MAVFLPNRRRFLGGLALTTVALGLPTASARATDAAPRVLTAGPGEALLLEAGQPKTKTWLYDGVSPGPIIRARQGEEVFVRLKNELPQPTTLHWHGIRIDNAMDGVAGLTQDPVPPGGSFDYRFTVPDAGTFWYHPHNRTWEQMARGLYGLLIVDEAGSMAQHYDQDIAIVADDWRLGEDGQIDEASFGHMRDWSHAGRLGNTLTLNGQDLLTVPVVSGEHIRLRLCNTCNARILELRIEDHQVWLVAQDGQPVAPRELDDGYIALAPGERADVVLYAKLDPGSQAAITEVSRDQRLVAGRVIYDPGASVLRDDRPIPPHPLPANPLPSKLDLAGAQVVDLLMEGGAMGNLAAASYQGETLSIRELVRKGKVWSFNGVAGMTDAPLFTARLGRTVTVDLRNDTRWPHAMHFHGHHVKVLERNGKPAGSDAWKDTVLVDPLESAKLAFVADNPGKWMIHCHMLEHQAAGMATWFKVEA